MEKNLAAGPAGVVDSLVQEFAKFNEGKTPDDDVTIVVARFLPENA